MWMKRGGLLCLRFKIPLNPPLSKRDVLNFRLTGICLAGFIFLETLIAPVAHSKTADILIDQNPPSPVLFGVKELKRVLEDKKIKAVTVYEMSDSKSDITIAISDQNIFQAAEFAPPEGEESYTLKKLKNNILWGWGRDPVGAMYAAYEIAEQIKMMKGDNIFKNIKEKTEAPFIRFRAVNIFFHTQAFADPDSWYYSEKFWEDYLDVLSKNRWNVLDIHAMYDIVSTGFPNAYLYLLKSEKYPHVGVDAESARKNLEMLNKLIHMAKERGIKTSLMSYKAGWEMSGQKLDKQPSEKELAEYTTEVVEKIIRLCPELWMIGFRVGESGRPAEYLRNIYLEGIKKAGRDINLFTRTWLVPPEQILSIANAYPQKTYIEIKYNGEQLGLPYHAMTTPLSVKGGMEPTYSYERYTNYPRNYKMIWQVRANGTHRLFRFNNVEFIRRAVKSFKFGDGDGFTIEPYTAYYPWTDFFHKPGIGHDYFTYDFERNWFWYGLWGRLSYNPYLSEKTFMYEFEKRFGKDARAVYEAVNIASKIIPLIYSYNCLGMDHRHMAPEFETGGTVEDFTRLIPLDITSMHSIKEFVWFYLNRPEFVNLKLTPFKAANMLDDVADRSTEVLNFIKNLNDSKEFDCIKMEIEALSHLAKYYSNKIRSAVHFEFFKQTNDIGSMVKAKSYSAKAVTEWDKLSEAGEKHYRPFIDTLRMKTREFTWRKEGEKLIADMNIISEWEDKLLGSKELKIGHLPLILAKPERNIPIEATWITDAGAPDLYYKKEGAQDYQKIPLLKKDMFLFASVIPKPSSKTKKIQYYLEAQKNGKTIHLPEKNDYTILMTDDTMPPEIHVRLDGTEEDKIVKMGSFDTKDVKVRVEVKDNKKVSMVIIKYKRLPSTAKWQEKIMDSAGKNLYETELRVSKAGLMYLIQAVDVNYNASLYPDFLNETPYIVIKGWE